jgi:quercetin dioxygenase-like cupin family protein
MSTNGKKKRGMTIYRAADATDLIECGFMSMPTMSEGAAAGFGEALASGLGSGGEVKVLCRQNDEEGGFSLIRLWFKPEYPLPRHSHDADCMYYVLSGTAVMGRQTLKAGDAFFIPDGAPYQYHAGPEGVEVLEIRHGCDHFGMKIPDASSEHWAAMKATAEANRERWEADGVSPTMVANQA